VFTKRFAIAVFVLFFLFFETQFLLFLNYSNTGFVLAISGLSSFLFHSLNASQIFYNHKKLVVPSVLILLSGLLRVHALTLGLLLSLEIIMFFTPILNLRKIIAWLLPPCIVLLLFIVAHNHYYDKKIPNTKEEEKFRQSLFYIANHTNTSKIKDTGIVQVRNSFIESYFLYDTTFTGLNSLEIYTRDKIHNTYRHGKDLSFIQYWLLLNSRIYLVLLGVIAFAFVAWKDHKSLVKWFWMFLLLLTTLIVFLFFKVTDGMFTTFISFMFIAALLIVKNGKISTSGLSTYVLALVLSNSVWMVIRIWKMNNANRKNIEVTRGTLAELNEHKSILFVHTNQFNDKGFYIWDTPKEYPVTNLINKELLLTNSYHPILRRFKINDLMEQLPNNPNALVAGPNPPLFEQYYLLNKGLRVQVVNVRGFKYLTAWAIQPRAANGTPGEVKSL
jgi:hypothetical protein